MKQRERILMYSYERYNVGLSKIEQNQRMA